MLVIKDSGLGTACAMERKMRRRADAIIRQQLRDFRKKFGRDPRPNEPIFFDPDGDTPTPISQAKFDQELLTAMHKSGAPPQFIYAFKKTGHLVTEGTRAILPPEDVAEWEAAIDEYFALEDKAKGEQPS